MGVVLMIGTFASELEHFARSVDIVDDATFNRVRDLIHLYIRREFRDIYFELLRRQISGNDREHESLETFWSSTDQRHIWSIHVTDETDSPYLNAATAAFDTGCSLWLTSGDDTHPQLIGAPLRNEWNTLEELPSYKPTNIDTATAAVIPLPSEMV